MTGTTPFEVVYGRKPPSVVRFSQGEIKVEAIANELLDRDDTLKQLKQHLLDAQEQMKKFTDLKCTDLSFKVGEWVSIKLKPPKLDNRRRLGKLTKNWLLDSLDLSYPGKSGCCIIQTEAARNSKNPSRELPERLEVDIDDREVSYGEILNSWRWLYEREGGLGKAHSRILFLQFRRKYLSGLGVPDSDFHLLSIVELMLFSLENQ
ncbi:hypothetical protein A2U01_0003453 [Trifolium medium]|uniref:Uncharacterized protein n=1 Tax=Trifolium medium TaxID=97028 RepID=A0A392M5H1_9FABA|nr:hypothetical protein [Trifolium medium]